MRRTWRRNENGLIVPGYETPRGFMPVIAGASHKDVAQVVPGGLDASVADIVDNADIGSQGTNVVAMASFNLPANTLAVKQVYRLFASGVINPTSGAPPNFVVRLQAQSQTTGIFTSTITASLVADKSWFFIGYLTCRGPLGAACVMSGSLFISNQAGSNAANQLGNGEGSIVVDSTAACLLRITTNWSAATTGNIATGHQGVPERVF